MAVMKMIQVSYNTHRQAKRQAKKRDMPMRAYIQFLLDRDDK